MNKIPTILMNIATSLVTEKLVRKLAKAVLRHLARSSKNQLTHDMVDAVCEALKDNK